MVWQKTNLSHVKVFGCVAYIHVPKQLRKKLSPKSKQVRFVGYCETSKGYRFLDVDGEKIIISRDAVFDENNMKEVASGTTIEKVTVSLTSQESSEIPQVEPSDPILAVEYVPVEVAGGSVDVNEEESDDFSDYSSAEEELNQPSSTEDSEEPITDERQGLRRSTRTIKKPERYAGKAEAMLSEPRSYKEAEKRNDFHLWYQGMQEEFEAI